MYGIDIDKFTSNLNVCVADDQVDGYIQKGKRAKRLRYRSRILDHASSHPIVELQKLLLKYLIRLDYNYYIRNSLPCLPQSHQEQPAEIMLEAKFVYVRRSWASCRRSYQGLSKTFNQF